MYTAYISLFKNNPSTEIPFCLLKITETHSLFYFLPEGSCQLCILVLSLFSVKPHSAQASRWPQGPHGKWTFFFFLELKSITQGWKNHVLWFWTVDSIIFCSQTERSQCKWPYFINRTYHSPQRSQQFLLFWGISQFWAVPIYKQACHNSVAVSSLLELKKHFPRENNL